MAARIQKRIPSKRVNFLKLLFSFLAGLVVAVALGEFALSHSNLIDNPPGQFRRSPTRAFEHTPLFKGKDRLGQLIQINSKGLRDREYTAEKPTGTFRIFVLGDSVAFGDGVKSEETFSERLEDLLNKNSAVRVEVLNGGIRGYNTYQQLLLLQEVGLGYKPDLVILCYVENDAEPFVNQAGLINQKHRWLIDLKEFIKQRSYLYAFFRKNFEVMRNRAKPQELVEHYSDQFSPNHPGWIASRNALKEMKQVLDANGSHFLLAVCPRLEGLAVGESYPLTSQKIHNQILETGNELGIETLDLLPALRGHNPEELKITKGDSFHPNPLGHKLIAVALEERVREKYL